MTPAMRSKPTSIVGTRKVRRTAMQMRAPESAAPRSRHLQRQVAQRCCYPPLNAQSDFRLRSRRESQQARARASLARSAPSQARPRPRTSPALGIEKGRSSAAAPGAASSVGAATTSLRSTRLRHSCDPSAYRRMPACRVRSEAHASRLERLHEPWNVSTVASCKNVIRLRRD